MGYDDALVQARAILATGDFDAPDRAEMLMLDSARAADTALEMGMSLRASALFAAQAGRVSVALERFGDAEALIHDPTQRTILYQAWASVVYRAARKDLAQALAKRLKVSLAECLDQAHPVLPFGFAQLARLHVLMQNPKEALSHALRAVELAAALESGRAEAFSALSATYEALGEVQGAMESLEEAMSYTTQRHCLMSAHADYSRLAMMQGDVMGATQHLQAAVEPFSASDRIVLAKIQKAIIPLVKSDPDAAVRLLERLSSLLEV